MRDSVILKLWYLALYCCCADNIKYGPLSKHFQRPQHHGGWRSPQSNDKLLLKNNVFKLSNRVKKIIGVICANNILTGE